MNELKTRYSKTIRQELKDKLELGNIHQVPRIEKIVVNAGVGRSVQDSKHLDNVVASLTKITGQKPLINKARHSIAGFKLREGNPIGASVTLRGDRMYYFLDRLIRIVLPRIRDFRGLSLKSFDPQGNYSIGIREHTAFPEISYEDAANVHGLQINIVTTAKDRQASEVLLREIGLPFERRGK